MSQKKKVGDLISKITSGYEKHFNKEITQLDYLPDKGIVSEIILLLQKLLFPGYFNKGAVNASDMECVVQDLVAEIKLKLHRQICRTMNLDCGHCEKRCKMADKAEEKCNAFLETIPGVIDILATDVEATLEGDPAAKNKHEIIFTYPGLFAISIYRLAHQLHLLSIPLLPRMMTEHAHSLTGIDIHPGAKIGSYFCIDHGTGLVIGETTVIGSHVKLYQGVTIGALSTQGGQKLKGKKRHPTLEDNVVIYSGATILGGETVIGSGSVIGGNVFITQSVPSNTKVNMKLHELEYKRYGMNKTDSV